MARDTSFDLDRKLYRFLRDIIQGRKTLTSALDTPNKRLSFLFLCAGLAILCIPALWYTSEGHRYSWHPSFLFRLLCFVGFLLAVPGFLMSFMHDATMKFVGQVRAWIKTGSANIENMTNPQVATHPQAQPEARPIDTKTLELMAQIASSDPDPDVRAEARSALKQLFPGGEDGFSKLLQQFIGGVRSSEHKKWTLASVMLIGLSYVHYDEIVSRVQTLIEDADPEVRRRATRILLMIEQDRCKKPT